MAEYNHRKIEKKWQKVWEKKRIFEADDHSTGSGQIKSKKPKFYGLIEFPYPSGEGLHVGHIRSNTAMDVISRKRRMEGFNVLYPIGWDAFGLPTENYAIKTGIHPIVVTKKNTDTFRRQLQELGFSFDWSREINTTDPKYYKWTQWIFLQFLKHGLAYKKRMPINWCPKDKIGLANEEVIDGKCERCGTPVEKRDKEQWMLAITKYAERLDKDLDEPTIIRGEKRELPKKILIGTRNPAKVKMVKTAFPAELGTEFVSLNDLPPVDDSALVEGDDFRENARKKAEFYFKKTGLPTISTDHIFWIEKFPENGGYIIHARKLANPNSPRATDDEVAEWIEKFVDKHGESKAAFNYAVAYTDKNGTVDFAVKQKEYLLQKSKSPLKNDGYVFDRYLKDLETGEFRVEQHFEKGFSLFNEFIKKDFLKIFTGEYRAAPPDYLEKIKIQQKNWIGRSEGAVIKFKVESLKLKVGEIEVFTTRPDTLFGATYLVLAPENPVIENWKSQIKNWDEVVRYIVQSKSKTEMERTEEGGEKTGVELKGIRAINPANGEEIPVWIADYVLADYGTGAIMAVPAHDERDFEFAKKYNLPIKAVIKEEKFFEGVVQKNNTDILKEIINFAEKNNIFVVLVGGLAKTLDGYGTGKNSDVDLFALGDGFKKIAEYLLSKGFKMESHEESFGLKTSEAYYTDKYWVDLFPLKKDGEGYYDNISGKSFYWKGNIKETKIDSDTKVNIPDKQLLASIYQNMASSMTYCFTGSGIVVHSDKFTGMKSEEVKWKITGAVGGKRITKFKLRDWVFSRQHYWGEPIPVVFCEKCGVVPVPEKDLPVELPKVEKYLPTDTGESPLAAITKWVNTKCPHCGGPARRETDTMPNWAGSSWYYLRYIDPKNNKAFVGKEKLNYWCGISPKLSTFNFQLSTPPVDWYNGGMEHTTLHLLYSRFWHKFLFDLGLVPTSEPYAKRTSHGLILAEGGVKMSKSKGNVINPDGLVERFGADSLRLYEMFMGPFDQSVAWSPDGIVGTRRFVEKVWRIGERLKIENLRLKKEKLTTYNLQLTTLLHKTVKKVGEDVEAMRFNTAISALMICANEMDSVAEVPLELFEMFLKMLAPFAPHVADELWSELGHKQSLAFESWPTYDKSLASAGTKVVVVQVNGKVRGNLELRGKIEEIDQKELEKMALDMPEVAKWIKGKIIKKVVYVKGRLLNLVVV